MTDPDVELVQQQIQKEESDHEQILNNALDDVLQGDGDNIDYNQQNDQKLDLAVNDNSTIPVDGYNNNSQIQQPSTDLQVAPVATSSPSNNYLDELKGKYLELDVNGDIVYCKINNISSSSHPDAAPTNVSRLNSTASADRDMDTTMYNTLTKKEKRKTKVEHLIKESTNRWLYITDTVGDKKGEEKCCEACSRCTNSCVNKFIALAVIGIQVSAYLALTFFLVSSVANFQDARQQTCYGPNCDDPEPLCIKLHTGALTSVMLVGFLWADVINAVSICHYNCIASFICLAELVIAISCGFAIGLYTESDFDAISGAIGILFVHDLDERVFASMLIISRHKRSAMCKKLAAVFLWIFVSLAISFAFACVYTNGSVIATGDAICLEGEFRCVSNNKCIWGGYECNGVKDCLDGSDEGSHCSPYCERYSNTNINWTCSENDDSYGSWIECGTNLTMCHSDGLCMPKDSICNGILDCVDGSDEGRTQDCATVILLKPCEPRLTIVVDSDGWHETWEGQFKCSNGQCINAKFACDGISGDCVDKSDEYPFFNQENISPIDSSSCPYSKLITCTNPREILCKIDGRCIPKEDVCDGKFDCADGQDEEGCEYTCDPVEIADLVTYQCGSSIAYTNQSFILLSNLTWIDVSSSGYGILDLVTKYNAADRGRCDGVFDCDDGSDEVLCTLIPCKDGQYKCKTSGKCISQEWLCDYIPDCYDGTDEKQEICDEYGKEFPDYCDIYGDEYNNIQCPDNELKCIPQSWFCDNVIDCGNALDEDPVYCNQVGVTPAPNYVLPPVLAPVATTPSPTSLTSIYCNSGDISGGIYTIGSKDSYSFTLPLNVTSVIFSTCTQYTADSLFDTKLYLYDSTGTTLYIENDDAKDNTGQNTCVLYHLASEIDFNSTNSNWSPGTVYILKVGHFSDGAIGNYALFASCS